MSLHAFLQVYTQTSEKRPYGVGMLIIGHDKTGLHLYETSPSGVFFEYRAQSFGARSQSAKTYIERHIDVSELMFFEYFLFIVE